MNIANCILKKFKFCWNRIGKHGTEVNIAEENYSL